MKVRSLGYRTDLFFPGFDGEIVDREDYLVIRTPANPSFYWGNFLLFAHPPQPGDNVRWPDLFAREIGAPPEVRHQTFGWDTVTDETGETEPFLADGFRLNHMAVLTAQQVHPPRNPATEVKVRPLLTDLDWEQALANQVICREPEHNEANHRVFKQRQMARYRAMAEGGLGAWFGAFIGHQLVADLGIFHNQTLGRFQLVETHPDYRQRGIGGTLVFEAARYALNHFGIDTLVIVADMDSAAARLYGSVGFRQTQHQWGLERWE